jgi:hypothetical protein
VSSSSGFAGSIVAHWLTGWLGSGICQISPQSGMPPSTPST